MLRFVIEHLIFYFLGSEDKASALAKLVRMAENTPFRLDNSSLIKLILYLTCPDRFFPAVVSALDYEHTLRASNTTRVYSPTT